MGTTVALCRLSSLGDGTWSLGTSLAVSHREPELCSRRAAGNHRPWLRSCSRRLSRGCVTVVAQLLAPGHPPTPGSAGPCLSWPIGTWNSPYWGRRIRSPRLFSLLWQPQPFHAAPSCSSKTCLWAVGTQGLFTLATASHQANKWSLKWSSFPSTQNIYLPATDTFCLAPRFTLSWYEMVPPTSAAPQSLPLSCWHHSSLN